MTNIPRGAEEATVHFKYSAFGQTIPCGVLNTHVTRSHQSLHRTPHQPHSKPCHRFTRALFRRRRTVHVNYSAFGQTIPCGVLNTHVTRSHQSLHHTPHQPHSKPCHRFTRALFRRRRTVHVNYSAFGQTIPCGVLNTHVTRSHQSLHHTPHQPHSKPCHRFSRALFRRRRRRESAGEDKNMKRIHTQHGKNRLFYRPPCLPAKSEFFCQTKSHNLTPPELEAR